MRRLNESRHGGGLTTAMLALALALGLAMSPGTGHSTISVRDLWAPNGEVRAIARAGNTLYMGGRFSHVGPVSGPAVALDPVTAVAQYPYPGVAGWVAAVEPDGNGGWYVGGYFTAVQGQRRSNVAHLDEDGQVTPWNPTVDGPVYDIAVGPGVVYVVGEFLTVSMSGAGVVSRFGAAALDAGTGVPTHWNPDLNDFAYEVELGGGKVYLGGFFTAIYASTSPQSRQYLAEFTEVIPGNMASGALTGLFAGPDPSLVEVTGLELAFGKLFIGRFEVPLLNYFLDIYDLAASSTLYHLSSGGPVYDIAMDPATGIAFIGGSFASFAGGFRSNLAAFNVTTGNSVSPFNIGTDGAVRTLALSSNGLLVGGDFSTLGTSSRRGLGLVNPLTLNVLGWNPACGGDVRAVGIDGARVYAGGDFTIVNGVPRSNLAAMDETSGALLAWSPTADGMVEALMVSGGAVYAGGEFSNINGTFRNLAAAVDAVTGALTAFNPHVGGIDAVKTFAISGSTVYMGGTFSVVNGEGRVGIAAVHAVTGDLMTWNPLSNGAVHAITYVPGGAFTGPLLVVGGAFTQIGGQSRNYLAMLDPETGASGALDSPNGPVHALFVEPLPPGFGGYNLIYVGGAFTSVAGQLRNRIASLAAFGLVTSWNPNAGQTVYSIAKVGSTVFVGGAFTTIGGQGRALIAAIDASGTVTPWDPDAGLDPLIALPAVYSLLESGGILYVGGSYSRIAETPHSHFAGLGQVVTAVESEPVPGVTPMTVRVAPNPFDQSTRIQFSMISVGFARVTVYDAAGRRVREIYRGWLPSGGHTMPWDGRDDAGRLAATGIYFIGVKTPSGTVGSKVYRARAMDR